ncbi:hypothetical protein J3458_000686 [Metarhizium acridum]|uniref:uncharacterized protein n=1 Tax=Metarhizium acridum TaxID=92637 RepID=UPI001C6CEEE0|nr:hypothetical protein J3458_000686 [Metarhizium acridum]
MPAPYFTRNRYNNDEQKKKKKGLYLIDSFVNAAVAEMAHGTWQMGGERHGWPWLKPTNATLLALPDVLMEMYAVYLTLPARVQFVVQGCPSRVLFRLSSPESLPDTKSEARTLSAFYSTLCLHGTERRMARP